jgi:hypothetical protein
MCLGCCELADHLAPLVILGRGLTPGQVAEVQGNVPRKGCAALVAAALGVADGVG